MDLRREHHLERSCAQMRRSQRSFRQLNIDREHGISESVSDVEILPALACSGLGLRFNSSDMSASTKRGQMEWLLEYSRKLRM